MFSFWLHWKQKIEWYPRGLQISLYIWSPGLQDYSEVWNLKFFRNWGGILKLSDLDSLTIFIGGDSETHGFGLSDNFHLGVFWNSQIWTLWQFSFGGVFCTQTWSLWQFSFWRGVFWNSDLDSLTIFIWGVFWNSLIWTLWQFLLGGVFWNSQIWTLWQFSFGGVFWNSLIWTLWQFSFWGGILYLDLDSLTIFILGGAVFCISE